MGLVGWFLLALVGGMISLLVMLVREMGQPMRPHQSMRRIEKIVGDCCDILVGCALHYYAVFLWIE